MEKFISQKKLVGLFLGPLLMVSIILTPHPEFMSAKVWNFLSIIAFMITWWILEPVHFSVTALLPTILFPFLGIMDSYNTFSSYASPYIFLFLGGFIISISLEKYDLHHFIAYKAINLFGYQPRKILFALMSTTYFFSMWMSNTATCVLMLPVAMSIINLIQEESNEQEKNNFIISTLLAIPFSATIGGMATVLGSPPNLIVASLFSESFDIQLSFGHWIIFGLPFTIILLLSTWLLLSTMFNSNFRIDTLNNFIKEKISSEQKLETNQKIVLGVFITTILLWITRPFFSYVINFEVNDETIAMLSAISLFVIPSKLIKGKFILDWKDTEKLPWGILLLFGSGVAISSAINNLNIIHILENLFSNINSLHEITFVITLVIFLSIITEFINNTSLTIALLPLIVSIALALKFNPIVCSIVSLYAISMAFMLPVATPPNSFIFVNNIIKAEHMARAGIYVKFFGLILLLLFYILGLFDVFPFELSLMNSTSEI